MLDNTYTFKGFHANVVTQLTSEIDSETHFALFKRNVDVFILAPIVGLLYGTMDERDKTGQVVVDNEKKINVETLIKEEYILKYNYTLIMLLHDKDKLSIEERLNRAFRYSKGSSERAKCDEIFEGYLLGGIKILKDKLLTDAVNVDDYINNMFNFISEYNDRYEQSIDEEKILEMCISE